MSVVRDTCSSDAFQTGTINRAAASDAASSATVESQSAFAEVDVVILSLDRADDTRAAIESVLSQERIRGKVIVVDQGSGPDTLTALRRLAEQEARVLFHEVGHNAGCAGGRNIGTRLATAEIVVGLDNDAVFEDSGALAHVAALFAREPKLGAVGFRIINTATRQLDILTWAYPRAQIAMADQEFLATRFVGAGHAYRRSAFERLGGFDADLFIYMEEPEFCVRLIAEGYQILYTPAITILHNVSPERRISWRDGRYYLFTRNRLYSEFKNKGQLFRRILPMAVGYIVRGALNGVPWQAVQGCAAAAEMSLRRRRAQGPRVPLPPHAQRYILDHEARYQGSLWTIIKHDVLIRLPSDRSRPNAPHIPTSMASSPRSSY